MFVLFGLCRSLLCVSWFTFCSNSLIQRVFRMARRSQSCSHSDWFISKVLSSAEERSVVTSLLTHIKASQRKATVTVLSILYLFIYLFCRKMVYSLSPLSLLRICSLFCGHGVAVSPLNRRAPNSPGWLCSAWRRWSTFCTRVAPQSGRSRSGRSSIATFSCSTGTDRSSANRRTGRAGRRAWSHSRVKC